MAFFTLLAVGMPLPAQATDPLTMFLIGIAREMIMQQIQKAIEEQAKAPPPPVETYPGTLVQPEHLRRLIDDSFLYLSDAQRAEIFSALNAELLKPKNAAVRASMIEYFAHRALQVRAVQLRLTQLHPLEQEQLAVEFSREVAALPADEQRQLHGMLERSLLPVPPELNRRLIAALGEPPGARAVAAPQTAELPR
jgi:hypothetical protein